MNMNMDFNKLRERAAAAATEATNIVSQFNELDAMAEQDEYLKTDDLNVTGQNKKEKWVEDLDEDHHGKSGSGSAPVHVSAPNTATKQAPAEMMTPAAAAAPAPSATPSTLTHQQSSMGYESAREFADGSETPALDSIFGQAEQSAIKASGAAAPPPFTSPEERAQQLIAQALFQTPMSSMAPSRATSAVGETSFLDYDSAREDEDDNDDDMGGATTEKKGARESNNATPAAAETSVNETERENAVMDYLSKTVLEIASPFWTRSCHPRNHRLRRQGRNLRRRWPISIRLLVMTCLLQPMSQSNPSEKSTIPICCWRWQI